MVDVYDYGDRYIPTWIDLTNDDLHEYINDDSKTESMDTYYNNITAIVQTVQTKQASTNLYKPNIQELNYGLTESMGLDSSKIHGKVSGYIRDFRHKSGRPKLIVLGKIKPDEYCHNRWLIYIEDKILKATLNEIKTLAVEKCRYYGIINAELKPYRDDLVGINHTIPSMSSFDRLDELMKSYGTEEFISKVQAFEKGYKALGISRGSIDDTDRVKLIEAWKEIAKPVVEQFNKQAVSKRDKQYKKAILLGLTGKELEDWEDEADHKLMQEFNTLQIRVLHINEVYNTSGIRYALKQGKVVRNKKFAVVNTRLYLGVAYDHKLIGFVPPVINLNYTFNMYGMSNSVFDDLEIDEIPCGIKRIDHAFNDTIKINKEIPSNIINLDKEIQSKLCYMIN